MEYPGKNALFGRLDAYYEATSFARGSRTGDAALRVGAGNFSEEGGAENKTGGSVISVGLWIWIGDAFIGEISSPQRRNEIKNHAGFALLPWGLSRRGNYGCDAE